MKYLRTVLCALMILGMLFLPQTLVEGAQKQFVDARFVRKTDRYSGAIVLYHIVRHKPYAGSLSQWLKSRAEKYEKKHKGTYIEIEGMDEAHFFERIASGRRPDAYSFFSGTLYPDLLASMPDLGFPYREGLFQTDRCIPYCYSGYCKLIKSKSENGDKIYCVSDILAVQNGVLSLDSSEEKADTLYLDMRRAGDLMRYKEGFALSEMESIDTFSDAICWIGIDRETEPEKTQAILDFLSFLLEPDSQQTLNALGLFSVRNDVKDVPPETALKKLFRTYESVTTVDPFRWNLQYDSLKEDAALARKGDADALERFTIRLRECLR